MFGAVSFRSDNRSPAGALGEQKENNEHKKRTMSTEKRTMSTEKRTMSTEKRTMSTKREQ